MSETEQLKLTKVVLFKAGIGSFQKLGQIDLSQQKTVKITFKNTVMNDLLKTFSILRQSGDLQISGISYEAKDTNKAKILENSEINLPEQNVFSTLLRQLRGVEIKLKLYSEDIAGRVIGIQSFDEAPTGQAIINQEYVMISQPGAKILPVKIAEIVGLEIQDPKVQEDFQFFLETIVGQNKEKNKTITIFFGGKEQSKYLLNFLQEVPAWKTSYRVFLNSAVKEGEERENLKNEFGMDVNLQGWAIIDNVLDEDWEDVDLTLVTGLPVSFIYDSYSPAWISRPRIERKTDLGVKVVQYDRAPPPPSMAPAAPPGGISRSIMAPSPKMAKSRGRLNMAQEPPAEFMMDALCSEVEAYDEDDYEEEYEEKPTFESESEVEGGKGLAFKYHIKNPVFVKRNNSSLIPLLQSQLGGKILSIYNENVNQKYPMKALEFKNGEITLEEGPISIFIENTFAGEAMLPFMEAGTTQRVPFAVNQSIEIVKEIKSHTENFHEIEISNAVYKRYFMVQKTIYKLHNLGDTPQKLIVEHLKKYQYELFDTEKPEETTPNVLRFFVTLNPTSTQNLVILERKLNYSQDTARNLSVEILDNWKKLKLINQEEYDYLLKRIQWEREAQEIEAEIRTINEKMRYIEEEQARLRENLRSLKDSEAELKLRTKYIQKFETQEDEYEQYLNDLHKAKENLETLNKKIQEFEKDWIQVQKAQRQKRLQEKQQMMKMNKNINNDLQNQQFTKGGK